MEKKTYTPPTLTDHGSIVEKTKGNMGFSWEWTQVRWIPDEGPPIKPDSKN